MSRRYRIEIVPVTTPATGNNVYKFTSTATANTGAANSNTFGFTSQIAALPPAFKQYFPMDVVNGGTVNTSYLDIEFDLNSNSSSSQNQGAQMITIKGVTPEMVAQVQQLNGSQITIYGGFADGMPLASAMANLGFNPLVKGFIVGAFGNWVGTDIYICLPILPQNGVGQHVTPNLTVNGKKGEQWQTVITRSLQQVMSDAQFVVDVNPNLVLAEDHQGTGYTLDAIGQVWITQSLSILGSLPNYSGVRISWRSGVLYVTDNPNVKGSKTVTLKAEQLVGNPVWKDTRSLQVICPMRSDIYIEDTVLINQDVLTLAPSNVTTGMSAYAGSATVASLSGYYKVLGIRHLGRARSPEALDWVTIIDMGYQSSDPSSQTAKNDGTQPFGQKTT